MGGSKLAVLAGSVLVTGVCGCSLPQVLPVHGGATSGPSPYGVWYEQHWATNAVLLAAADQVESEIPDLDEEAGDDLSTDIDGEATGDPALDAPADAPVEASAGLDAPPADFDDSTPYQFPSSAFAPAAPGQPSVEELTAPPPAPAEKPAAPAGGSAPIRY